jgi:TolB protein
MINTDGTGLTQITYNDSFDGFPVFSYDGSKLVWASGRNAQASREINVFIADWVE